nr:M10 family metallopeptidase C-terminal domain-containing protein [Prochlorococcus marinus]
MVADWIALDDIYSSEGFGLSNAFHGDTIYGFNTNISSDVSLIWNQFSTNASSSAYTIVDGKGNDTIDLSGFSDNQTIDLRPTEKSSSTPYVSNIGGLNGNLCIAPGTYIESAIGGSGNDELIGNNENNTLNGGSGNDTLIGGAGDDTYVVDSTSDTVTEKSSEGTDLIQSSVTFTASNNVENLTLTGSGNINATGNTLDNTLTGNTRNNTLNGGSGNDTLIGGNGDDILIGGNGNDTAQFSLDIYNYKVWKGTNLIVTDKKLNRGGKDQLSSIETISLNGTSIDISNLRTGMYVHSNNYQLLGDNGSVTFHTGWNDNTSSLWDVVAAKNNSSSFEVLFDGTGSCDGQVLVWTTNSSGAYVSESGWLTDAQATAAGYESIFNMDLNNNGSIGS